MTATGDRRRGTGYELRATGPDTDSVDGGVAFGTLAPELAKTLMDDAAAAMSSPE